MTRLQGEQRAFKGGITAFLTLVFILMLSIVGALIESVSVQIALSRKRSDTILAMESVFAEYQKDMLDRYDLFVKVGTGERAIKERLSYYGAKNQSNQIVGMEVLTDNKGMPFYEQSVQYMRNWLGAEEEGGISHDFSTDGSFEAEMEANRNELQAILKAEEVELSTENNPISSMEKIRKSSLLSSVVPTSHKMSGKKLRTEALASKRELQKGNWEQNVSEEGLGDKALFVAYLAEHFANMTDANTERMLTYEQEYLLAGYGSDQKNLESVCDTILDIRTIANYTYLQTDTAKKMEAEAMARAMCGLVQLPGLVAMVKQTILYEWAYGESVVDMRALLSGKKVASVKTKSTWQLSLSEVIGLGLGLSSGKEKDVKGGLDYQAYLTGLLLLEDRESLCMRSLDLIESNLQIKADQCVTKMALKSEVTVQYGVKKTFLTVYGYQ